MTNRDMVAIALFSAFFIGCNLFPSVMVPYMAVPITAQTLGVTLTGALLGAKRGFIAIFIVLLLAALGMPVLAGGSGGLGSFYKPSTGYLLAFPIAAFITGKCYEFYKPKHVISEFFMLVLSTTCVIHSAGVIWLSFYLKMPILSALIGDLIFIPGDFLKLILAMVIIRFVRKNYPTAFRSY